MRDAPAELLEDLYSRHAGAVLAASARACLSTDDAEDVAQETFARALQAARSGRHDGRGDGLAWLLAIMRRCAAAGRRKAMRERVACAGDVPESIMPSGLLLAELPENVGKAAEMRHLGNRPASYAEIAATLRCSETTARRRCAAAERAVRRSFAGDT